LATPPKTPNSAPESSDVEPKEISTNPPDPEAALPLANLIEPLFPTLEVPVEKTRVPLAPASPAFVVEKNKLPLVVSDP
jgi:hypothetical protein